MNLNELFVREIVDRVQAKIVHGGYTELDAIPVGSVHPLLNVIRTSIETAIADAVERGNLSFADDAGDEWGDDR